MQQNQTITTLLSSALTTVLFTIEILIALFTFPFYECDRLNYNSIFYKQIFALSILFLSIGLIGFLIKQKWNSKNNPISLKLSLIVTLIATLFGLLFLYQTIKAKVDSVVVFDSTEWLKNNENRTPMMRYLNEQNLLLGKNKSELILMLGKSEYPASAEQLSYSLTDTFTRAVLEFNSKHECVAIRFDCYD